MPGSSAALVVAHAPWPPIGSIAAETVGSPEATALGNAGVQGLALGQFERLEDARRWLAIGAQRLVM